MTSPQCRTSNRSLRYDTRKGTLPSNRSPTSSAHRSINFMLPSIVPARRTIRDVFKKAHEAEVRFDIISHLPKELALLLFSCLPLQDLCRCAVVCRKWYHLNQDRFLKKRRLQFVRAQKNERQSELENIPPPMTPQDHHTSCPRTTMVSAGSPLSVIQYSSASLASRRKSIPSPMANVLRTPTQHYPALVESTARLTIADDENIGIRRCLFPFDRDTSSAANQHPAEKISKRSSKARLKRL